MDPPWAASSGDRERRRFVPDFCHPADPEPKGIVENLVGYAKRDLVLPDSDDLAVLNDACRSWCSEVNARQHTETCAVPDVRLAEERPLLRELPMLRPRIGRTELRRSTSCPRFRIASARYSVPHRLVGEQVEAVTFDGRVRIYDLDGLEQRLRRN